MDQNSGYTYGQVQAMKEAHARQLAARERETWEAAALIAETMADDACGDASAWLEEAARKYRARANGD